jgi:hypothetical protein
MQCAGTAKRSWAATRSARSGRATADARSTHHGLAGTNRTAIDGLAGDGRGAASRHAGPGGLRLYLSRRRTGLLLLEPRHHIGARRHYRTRGRLSSEIGARLRAQRRSRCRRRERRSRFARRRDCRWRSAGLRLRWKRDGCRRHRRGGSRRGQGLTWSRQDLTRARRWNRPCRNWTGTQGGMQRRSAATRRQWRPQRRGLAAKRFFDRTGRTQGSCNGGLLRGRCAERF